MRHLVIPDTQIKPGVCINHLNALGNYIVDKQFEKIIMLGDWADMHSLSSYDKGTKNAEGARVHEDIQAAKEGMHTLMEPIYLYNDKQTRDKKRRYKPELHLLYGNHEIRIDRHINANPILDGTLSKDLFEHEMHGWETHEFLDVLELDGVLYSHFFPRNTHGKVMQSRAGAPSASAQVKREMQSATSGHTQGLDWHVQQTGTRRYYGLIAGSFYMHEEGYLTPQGTEYWRGVVVKNEVNNGSYDIMTISIDYLLNNYWDGVNRYA